MNRKQYIEILNNKEDIKLLLHEFFESSNGLLSNLPPKEVLENIRAFAQVKAMHTFENPDEILWKLVNDIKRKYDNKFSITRLYLNDKLIKIL